MSKMGSTNPHSLEQKSISMILKQKQQSRFGGGGGGGGGRGGRGGGARNAVRGGPPGPDAKDNLNPILPPTYPNAPACATMNKEVLQRLPVYESTAQFFRSNYTVSPRKKKEGGFDVERYTDQYQSPLTLKPHMLPSIIDSRFHDCLNETSLNKAVSVKKTKRKIEDLPDVDDLDLEENVGKTDNAADDDGNADGKQETNADDMDELDEEDNDDDEMDLGTDYAQSYFDNGEGDDDDRDDDDGAIY